MRGAGAAASELVEVVDDDGRVLDIVTRAEMRRRRLRHRSVFVAVVDPDDAGCSCTGAPTGRTSRPGRWDIAFGGVVGAGEAWDAAAARELEEEAGVGRRSSRSGRRPTKTTTVPRCAGSTGPAPRVRSRSPTARCRGRRGWTLDAVPAWLDGRQVCPDSVAVVLPRLGRSGMSAVAAVLLAVTIGCAVANWIAVASEPERTALVYVAKPATMVALIGVAIALDPFDPAVRAWFVAALVLCLAGDVFLMLPQDLFVAGLASFLLGHLCYVGRPRRRAPVVGRHRARGGAGRAHARPHRAPDRRLPSVARTRRSWCRSSRTSR